MRSFYRRLTVVFALALLPLSASALTVVVNGQTLPSYPPAIQTAGRTLLPMRTVFEALGAQVFWDRATQTALGTRGAVTVRMTINST
ncbi:MAG: copper amine oxidase N-terminal domain-containing protein, partial [Armatimonadota bacterium]